MFDDNYNFIQEGIVRFGTDKFDLNQLKNVFSHLTNTSINKYGPSYATDKERVGPGCKWTLSQVVNKKCFVNVFSVKVNV